MNTNKNKNNNNNDNNIKNKEYFINPWKTPYEFLECYENIFGSYNNDNNNNEFNLESIENLSLEKLSFVIKNYLIPWEMRSENKAFSLTSLLIFETIFKIKNKEFEKKNLDNIHILSIIIIRVTNLLIDYLKKSKIVKDQNMFLISKEINLPNYIVQIRHKCTHKNLPEFNDLIFCIKNLFIYIKIYLWDNIYKKIKNENDIYFLFQETEIFLQNFFIKITQNKNKIVFKENVDENIKEYSYLKNKYGFYFDVVLFNFIRNNFNVDNNNNNIFNNKVIFFAKFLTKCSNNNNNKNKIDNDILENNKILFQSIYKDLESKNNKEILNCFKIIFKDFKLKEDFNYDKSEDDLYEVGNFIYFDNNENNIENNIKDKINNNNNSKENNINKMEIEEEDEQYILPINNLIL